MPRLTKIIFLSIVLPCTLLFGIAINSALAEVIDRIQINQAGEEAEIQIRFITRIQYLRQVELRNGDIRIYFNLLEIDPMDPRLRWQKSTSPPSNISPRFTVTYPELDSSLTISFGKKVDYRVRPGNDGRSISIFTPIIKPDYPPKTTLPLAAPAATPLQPAAPRNAAEIESIELAARQLMDKASAAQKNNAASLAIDTLKQLLNLPPNQQTQAAQLMLGQAYEKNGEFAKARAEYDLYIKRYPKADNLNQVKESLAKVFMAAYLAGKSAPEKLPITGKMTFFGGISQNYYRSVIHTDNTTPSQTMPASTSDMDQSQLLSSLELTGLKRTESTETRLAFRDTFTANFLPDIGNSNFLDAAYIEQGANDQSHYYGLGRQTGTSGGTPSRFDGLWIIHNLNSSWHVKGSLGTPVLAPGIAAETKTFAAINIDLTRQPGQWSGNLYLIGQRVANIMDRRAVGVETRYSDALSNHMGLLEYDTLFKKINAGLLQGNWTTTEGANYSLMIDHRKHLQITNALLLNPPPGSINELLNSGVPADTLLTDALVASPYSNQLAIGITQPYNTRLKFGGDILISNTTSYEAYDATQNARMVFPGVWAHTFSAQVAGNNLIFDNDLGVARASYTHASTYKAETLTFSQAVTFRQNWQLNILLQLYAENSMVNGYMMRVNPSFKLSYLMSQSFSLEIGAGIIHTDTSNFVMDSKSHNKYFNFGYRKNF